MQCLATLYYKDYHYSVPLVMQAFSSGLYPYFRDENGNPRTGRDQFGFPPKYSFYI